MCEKRINTHYCWEGTHTHTDTHYWKARRSIWKGDLQTGEKTNVTEEKLQKRWHDRESGQTWHIPAPFNASWHWNKGRQRGAELPQIKKHRKRWPHQPPFKKYTVKRKCVKKTQSPKCSREFNIFMCNKCTESNAAKATKSFLFITSEDHNPAVVSFCMGNKPKASISKSQWHFYTQGGR